MVPDAVVGHPRIGRQHRPQRAELAVVFFLAQRGPEAPEGELRAAPVDVFTIALHQASEVREAARLEFVQIVVTQAGKRAATAQVVLRAGQRVDQHRLLRPAHLRPVGDLQRQLVALLRRVGYFLQRPLRSVRSGSPPVGTLYGLVDAGLDAVLEQHAVQHVGVVGVDGVHIQVLLSEQSAQHTRGPAFMAFRVAQQHQRLFRRVVQAGVELGVPKGVVGHGGVFRQRCAAALARVGRGSHAREARHR